MERWEYEPKDALDHFLGWRPDFKIWIHNEPVYCEVKPLWLSTLPDWVVTKICSAETVVQFLFGYCLIVFYGEFAVGSRELKIES